MFILFSSPECDAVASTVASQQKSSLGPGSFLCVVLVSTWVPTGFLPQNKGDSKVANLN